MTKEIPDTPADAGVEQLADQIERLGTDSRYSNEWFGNFTRSRLAAILAALRNQPALTDGPSALLRSVVAHATGGQLDLAEHPDFGLNDICVRITQFRNQLWKDAQASALPARTDGASNDHAGLIAALHECSDKLWVLRCNSRDPLDRAAAEKAFAMAKDALQALSGASAQK